MIKNLRKRVDMLSAEKSIIKKDLNTSLKKVKELRKQKEYAAKAHLILQTTAKKTQQQLEYKISELVTLSQQAVFKDSYSLRLIYEMKRNKTEAQLIFDRHGYQIDPLEEGGYGPVDVAGFSLRASLWSLRKSKLDNILILDEPFKNINDDSRRLHQNVAEMVSEVSKKLNLQILMTSQIPEMREIADVVFEVKKKKGISIVKEK